MIDKEKFIQKCIRLILEELDTIRDKIGKESFAKIRKKILSEINDLARILNDNDS